VRTPRRPPRTLTVNVRAGDLRDTVRPILVGHFEQDAPGLARGQRALRVQTVPEVFTVHQRHDEVDDAVAFVDAVNRDDVRVTQLRRSLCLTQEARANLGAEGKLGRKDLDRDRAFQPAILCLVDDAHPPTPDLAVELVSRREYSLDVRAKVWVCRWTDWLGHAVGLAGYDDGAIE